MLAALVIGLAPVPVFAATEPLQPAPVSGLSDGHVAPADRAGGGDLDRNSAPFSAAPSNEISGRGQRTPESASGAGREAPPTPSLSK